MSEAELFLLRSRLTEGLRSKAARGELRLNLPAGLDYDDDDHVIIAPDEAVAEAIATVFRRFDELGSARQVVVSLRRDELLLPRRNIRTGKIVWAEAGYPAVHDILIHPGYAGVFAYGRSKTEKYLGPDGKVASRQHRLPREEWQVMIPGHHPGYISLEAFEANLAQLAGNKPVAAGDSGGAAREGRAWFQGLIRCGRCGRPMQVTYPHRSDNPAYVCGRSQQMYGAKTCQRIAGRRLEEAVLGALFATLAPAALQATGNREKGRRLIADILARPGLAGPDPAMDLLRMLCGHGLTWCENHEMAGGLLSSSVDTGRAQGRLADLPYGLAVLSELHYRTGEWGQAYADAAEATELGADFATTSDLCYALVCTGRIEAAMGAAQECRAHLHQALSLASPAGVESITVYAAAAAGLLELGLANYQRAAAELARAASLTDRHGLGDPCVIQWRPDYIESLARTGRLEEAREQLTALDHEEVATGSEWAKVTAARSRGLILNSPDQAIAALEHAITVAEASPSPFEQARARLYLGEALRHARRRSDARPQLEQAYTAFVLLGAQPWAERAAAELAATGITAAPRRTPIHARLTPQELRIALQVAEGLTNQEVATRLFLSPKTIEVHLSHIYSKLGVHSRTSLARLVNSGAVQTAPATTEADATATHH